MSILDEIRDEIVEIRALFNKACSFGDHSDIMAVAEDRLNHVLTLATEQNALINARLHISTTYDNRPTYAAIVKKPSETTTVLIYPKDDSSHSAKTMSDLKLKLDPVKLCIEVDKTRFIKHAGVAITLNSKEQAETLKNQISTEDFDCVIKKKRNPFIKLHGVTSSTNNEDIINAISRSINVPKNFTDEEQKSVAKIIRRTKIHSREDSANVTVQVDCRIWKQLIDRRYLNVQWEKVLMTNYVPVLRCFNCQRFGHTAEKCPEQTACGHCGGKHETRTCKSVMKSGVCVNCLNFNRSNESTCQHAAYSTKCPVYLAARAKVEQSINYQL